MKTIALTFAIAAMTFAAQAPAASTTKEAAPAATNVKKHVKKHNRKVVETPAVKPAAPAATTK